MAAAQAATIQREKQMERTWREKIEGTTDQILAQIKRLIDEGNIRRVLVKQQGKVIAEFPLTVGVVGTVLAPVAAAIGALTAVLADCSIEVEKTSPPSSSEKKEPPAAELSNDAPPEGRHAAASSPEGPPLTTCGQPSKACSLFPRGRVRRSRSLLLLWEIW